MKYLGFLMLVLLQVNVFSQSFRDPVPSDSTHQKKDEKKFKLNSDDVFFGGGIGGGFSGNGGLINIAPSVGYNITDDLQTGVELNYSYLWGTTVHGVLNTRASYKDHIYTMSYFVRYLVWNGVFAQVEPQYMNRSSFYWRRDATGNNVELAKDRRGFFNFYVGGGAFLDLSSNSGAYVMLLYNLNQPENSLYRNPHLRVGFTFGL